MVTVKDLIDSFPQLLTMHKGNIDAKALLASSVEAPKESSIVYLSNKNWITQALDSQASIIITDESIYSEIKEHKNKAIICTANVQMAMALINTHFFKREFLSLPFDGCSIHSTANVSKTAQIGQGVILGPGAVIGHNVVLGDNVKVGANTVIESNAIIGSETILHANVTICHNSVIGDNCQIQSGTVIGGEGFGFASDQTFTHFRKPHYGKVIINDKVNIGSNVCIDRGAFEDSVIGEGTQIDNICHFAHNIKIGKNCIFTGGFMCAGSVTIGDRCVFGGRTTVTGHISICNDVHTGGLTGVTKSITEPGAYAGFPFEKLRDNLKTRAAIKKFKKYILKK